VQDNTTPKGVTVSETATQPLTTPFEYGETMVISVNVSNFDAALEWYGKALGFELVYRLDQYGWGEVRTPLTGITIGLGQTEELKHGGTVPTFTVKDIEAARAHLESLDTRFDGDTYEIDGMVKLATFYDPDGNAWMLAERLPTDDRNH
jgi:catechol 2,3-dioxygenase-like lactoylglutathione lyase family enzyme